MRTASLPCVRLRPAVSRLERPAGRLAPLGHADRLVRPLLTDRLAPFAEPRPGDAALAAVLDRASAGPTERGESLPRALARVPWGAAAGAAVRARGGVDAPASPAPAPSVPVPGAAQGMTAAHAPAPRPQPVRTSPAGTTGDAFGERARGDAPGAGRAPALAYGDPSAAMAPGGWSGVTPGAAPGLGAAVLPAPRGVATALAHALERAAHRPIPARDSAHGSPAHLAAPGDSRGTPPPFDHGPVPAPASTAIGPTEAPARGAVPAVAYDAAAAPPAIGPGPPGRTAAPPGLPGRTAAPPGLPGLTAAPGAHRDPYEAGGRGALHAQPEAVPCGEAARDAVAGRDVSRGDVTSRDAVGGDADAAPATSLAAIVRRLDSAPARPPQPHADADEVRFARTLEQVLLSETRRHGITVEER